MDVVGQEALASHDELREGTTDDRGLGTASLAHNAGDFADCDAVGPHSGPYGFAAKLRARCEERAPPAGMTIKPRVTRYITPRAGPVPSPCR